MIETKEKQIDGSTYLVTQMTARRALRMKAKLLKLFGTALAEIFLPSDDQPIEGLGFSKQEAINAIQSLSCDLEEKVFESLLVELLSGVRKDNVELTEAIIDMEFAGKLQTLYKVVWYVLEVNFSSFFGESGIGAFIQTDQPLKQTKKVKRCTAKR